ncbi:MAG TPA: alpha/beta fold hydrolase [Verrucomicrobiae bacterium]|nr:alpha/beta fold hydrolase [Verrucomicrobiae bacterium]
MAVPLVSPATTYYVRPDGEDTQSGTSIEQAWGSLARVNEHVFQPGDRVLFQAGSRFTGQLRPQGSGKLEGDKIVPITIGKYGAGQKPRIDGEGKFLDTLLLRNVEFWEVSDLEITNLGTNREPWRTGVRIATDGFGKMRHIRLRNLFVHDVNGDLRKQREGCGIYFESRGRNESHFDDLLIENCHVVRTDRNGICQRGGRTRSLGVVIRGNLLEDVGGDGIKIWGSNGALVEHNVVRGGRMRCDDYAAGIWPFDSDDTVIQFNEVSGMKGTKDGQGFDSDYRCRRSVFQYNYSHDNEGGFFLICAPGHSYNEDTVIRYNISQNDGINSARVFHISGAKNTKVYNNTIYIGPQQNLPLMIFNDWDGGSARDTFFYNNIFYVDGRVTYDFGKSQNTVFESNVFFGSHDKPPMDSGTITSRPALVKPGSGNNGLDSLNGYRLRHVGCLPGRLMPDNGGRDFFGNVISSNAPPCVGAAQCSTATTIRAEFLKRIQRPRVGLAPELKALPATNGVAYSHFTFASDADERVPGLLLKLEHSTNQRPVVIALHGTGGNKADQLPLLRKLATAGFIAIAIDGRYHGERTRAGRGASAYNGAIVRAWRGSGEHPFFYDTVWDVMRLLDYLATRDDVDVKRIGLIGTSKGGIETYLAAAADERIAAAVPCIGVQSFRWALENNAWQSRIETIQTAFDTIAINAGIPNPDASFVSRFYDRVVPGIHGIFDGPGMLPLIAPRPLLVINGDSDARTPLPGLKECTDAAQAAYRSAGASDRLSIRIQENTGHKVTAESEQAAIAWFVQWLKP